jgi:hypothetical protein
MIWTTPNILVPKKKTVDVIMKIKYLESRNIPSLY